MQTALADLNEELERGWGVRLANRTGVNTGEVVAGDVTAGQRLVTGDTVNVAARLEQAAAARGGAPRRSDVSPRPRRGRGRARRAARPQGEGGAGARLQVLGLGRRSMRWRGDEGRSSAGSASWGSSSGVFRGGLGVVAGSRPCSAARGWGSRVWPRSSSAQVGRAAAVSGPLSLARPRHHLLASRRDRQEGGGNPRGGSARDGAGEDRGPGEGRRRGSTRRRRRRPLREKSSRRRDLLGRAQAARDHGGRPGRSSSSSRTCTGRSRRCSTSSSTSSGRPSARSCSSASPATSSSTSGPRGRTWPGSTVVSLEPLADDAARGGEPPRKRRARSRGPRPHRGGRRGQPALRRADALDDGGRRGPCRQDGRWVSRWQAPTRSRSRRRSRRCSRPPRPPRARRARGHRGRLGRGPRLPEEALHELVSDEVAAQLEKLIHSTLCRKHLVQTGVESIGAAPTIASPHVLVREAAYQGMLKRTRATLHERFVGWADRVNEDRDRAVEFEEILGYHLEQALREPGRARPARRPRPGARAPRGGATFVGRSPGVRSRRHGCGGELLRARRRCCYPRAIPSARAHPDLGEALLEVGGVPWAELFLQEAIDARRDGDGLGAALAGLLLLRLKGQAAGSTERWSERLVEEARRTISSLGRLQRRRHSCHDLAACSPGRTARRAVGDSRRPRRARDRACRGLRTTPGRSAGLPASTLSLRCTGRRRFRRRFDGARTWPPRPRGIVVLRAS